MVKFERINHDEFYIRYNFWALRKLPKKLRSFWYQKWLPKWHKGRGHYITIGLYFIAIYRGY